MPQLQLDDINLYYESAGEGKPVLFIHGLGSSTRDWEMQVPFFARRYRPITVDVRGHGKSGRPLGPYSVPQFAGDIVRLLEALQTGPVHVVGISMGGMIAFQMAVSWPEWVRSLVVVNCEPELVVRTFSDRLKVWQRLAIVRLLGMRKMGQVLGDRLFPEPEQAELREVFEDRWAENDRRAYREALMALVGWSVADEIERITCPTLVVASDQDTSPVEAKEAYARRIPVSRLAIIENARHAVTVERPEEFNAVLDAFLSEQNLMSGV
jgi:pimeloyl-ACP methyl ester carboxylesterase